MVVTLTVVFHRLQDHGKNKEAKQGWKDDRINHGSSLKVSFWSSAGPTWGMCQSRDRYTGRLGAATIPQVVETSGVNNPSVEGGCFHPLPLNLI